ncbi:vWA domain-containing protein [Pararhizobium arenae]|uniref:vWA domain-containing protein n=1 Tax=Pararhizobium arenae TaxID=1856850 RepID=UPI001FDA0FE5|nr:TadE/TadG family type IV pilus assembly protein [Pararhizobium arenae]
MDKHQNVWGGALRLFRNRDGNFGLLAAVVLPTVLVTAGVAIDTTNLLMAKNNLQDAADSAALAASSALVNRNMSISDAKLLAANYLKAQMYNWNNSSLSSEGENPPEQFLDNSKIEISQAAGLGNSKRYVVNVSARISVGLNPFTQISGYKEVTVGAASRSESTTEARNALSMFLVLDRSGSMAWKTNAIQTTTKSCYIYEESYWPNAKWSTPCYLSKISSLKLAVANLLTQLKTADPTSSLVRTAAVSYNDKQDAPGTLAWGTTDALNYVNALNATGGTDSSGAIKAAYNALTATGSKSETAVHAAKNGQSAAKKFLVFMTDGENNFYNGKSNDTASDAETKKTCDAARDASIEVYTVAFMAPSRGQKLLKYCATDASHYFQAEDSAGLIAAFKAIGEKASDLTVRLTQ